MSHIDTLCLHAGQQPDSATNSRALPIYQTSSYVFNSAEHAAALFGLQEFGNIYTRLMNPTTDCLENRVAAIEGGTMAVAASSGMGAITLAIMNTVMAGDHIVASSSLYGGTETFLRYTMPRFGVETTFIADMTAEKVAAAIKPNTKIVYAETIGNPKGDVLDLEPIAKAAHDQGVCFMIDNTFAPIICQPKNFGADVVIHSTTKWIGGHGTSIGGVVVDCGTFNWGSGRYTDFVEPDDSYHGLKYWEVFGDFPGLGNVAFALKARVQGLRNMGMCPSPFNSFLHTQGLETLHLRMPRHCDNAMALATWLENHPLVDWVVYTGLPSHADHATAKKYLSGGFGSVFGFGPKGGFDAAKAFIDNAKLASHLANVGDAKTLVLHPASTSHQQLSEEAQAACGLSPDFVRVSVGIENIEDIKADFDQALKAAQG